LRAGGEALALRVFPRADAVQAVDAGGEAREGMCERINVDALVDEGVEGLGIDELEQAC
jgi:hypothetical protein